MKTKLKYEYLFLDFHSNIEELPLKWLDGVESFSLFDVQFKHL